MKEVMHKLVRDTELSRLVDQQEAKTRKKERTAKERRVKLKKEMTKQDVTKVARKNTNFATREMIMEKFPDFKIKNINFYNLLHVKVNAADANVLLREAQQKGGNPLGSPDDLPMTNNI